MNISELRYNSYYQYDGIEFKLGNIDGYSVVVNTADGVTVPDIDDVEGITLTKEWLIKFGCEKDENTINLFNNFGVFFQRIDNKLYLMSEDGGKRHIEYVHIAQNLYFVFRGEELEVK